MIVLESKIAKKYAIAFINVYKNECSPEYTDTLKKFSNFIDRDRIFQATLAVPSLSKKMKKTLVEHVSEKQNLSKGTERLIFLLLKDKRIDLLNEVIKKILFLCQQREKKYHFNVTTSHELSSDEQEKVLSFIKSKITNRVTASFKINKSLISGIKIESRTFFWERSIESQLKNIGKKL
jgi:ATP synthase F1 delta subunit